MKNIIEGILTGNERGYAFLTPVGGSIEEDYFIPHGDLRGAMHGDRVLCERTHGDGARTTARVLKILERGKDKIVGTYFNAKNGGFVVPDDKRYFNDIFIPFGKGVRAKAGDKVACKILSYPKKASPEGMVIKIFGRQFERYAELKSILYGYNLPEKFPKKVLEEAESLSEKSSDDQKRLDLTDKTIFTIDGETAKDFDDAVSIEKTKNGDYILGVHIADVSAYVKRGGYIDAEAFNRGNSTYFPESVIPMLPERLSNDLCSLKEGVKRLTVSCIMTIDGSGRITEFYLTPSIIKSVKRFTYTEVQKILDKDEETVNKNPLTAESVIKMEELADILTAAADREGAIDLDVKESEITVKENGEIEVGAMKAQKSHKIIEQFMIAANVCVAEYIYYLDLPFVYRVHEKPSPEKTDKFYAFLKILGKNPKRAKEGVYPKDFQSVLKEAENTPLFTVINRVMLRSMQKAKYSPEGLGHFGLSKKHYCHFTSPIRRYPDLIVHRILKAVLSGEPDVAERYEETVKQVAEHSSLTERNSMEAERAVDDYYKILYISDFIGEEFYATVSGVASFGFFAELDNGVEGLVKISSLKGKRYLFNESDYSLSDGKNSFRLGDKLKIKVLGVNLTERKAEFAPVY